jgi:hypothetical protein
MAKTPSPWRRLYGEGTKCEEQAEHLFEACEQLAYAYLSAIHRYTKDALTHTNLALDHLKQSGVDEDALEPITEPLDSVVAGGLNFASMGAHINDAQEELKKWAPTWARVCED